MLLRKLDAAASGDIETALTEARTALAGEDADAMNNAFERLQTSSHKLAEVLYSQTGAAGQAGGEPTAETGQASSATAGADGGSTGGDDNVIDAEYVDVEDGKK